MSEFKKETLETVYKTTFSDTDIDIINRFMTLNTKSQLEEDTRYFNSLKTYVDYVYLDNIENARTIINGIVDSITEVDVAEVHAVHFIPEHSNHILLPNQRFIVVMD